MSDSQPVDEAIADLLASMNRGQYQILVIAIQQAGGEVRFDPEVLARLTTMPLAKIAIDVTDGPVVIRLV